MLDAEPEAALDPCHVVLGSPLSQSDSSINSNYNVDCHCTLSLYIVHTSQSMDTWGIRIDGMPTGVQEDEIHRFLAPLTVAYKLTSIDHFRRSSSVAIVSFGKKSAQDVVHEIAKAALQNHWSVQPSAYRLKRASLMYRRVFSPPASRQPT